MKRLQKLQHLSIASNKITEINESLCECVGLHELFMSLNKISALPESMGMLINL
jgi:Leucine-rich repeat (LRR) protein